MRGKRRTLNDGINRAGFLTKAAVDTFGHVDVLNRVSSVSPEGKIVPTVFGGSSRAILPRLTLNGDGESRADCLAQFTRYPEIQISIR